MLNTTKLVWNRKTEHKNHTLGMWWNMWKWINHRHQTELCTTEEVKIAAKVQWITVRIAEAENISKEDQSRHIYLLPSQVQRIQQDMLDWAKTAEWRFTLLCPVGSCRWSGSSFLYVPTKHEALLSVHHLKYTDLSAYNHPSSTLLCGNIECYTVLLGSLINVSIKERKRGKVS